MTTLTQQISDLRDGWHNLPFKTVEALPFTPRQWVVLNNYRNILPEPDLSQTPLPKAYRDLIDIMPLAALRPTAETKARMRDLPEARMTVNPDIGTESLPKGVLRQAMKEDFILAKEHLFKSSHIFGPYLDVGMHAGELYPILHADEGDEESVPYVIGRLFAQPFEAIHGSVSQHASPELAEIIRSAEAEDHAAHKALRDMKHLNPCEVDVFYLLPSGRPGVFGEKGGVDGIYHCSSQLAADPVTHRKKPVFSAFIVA